MLLTITITEKLYKELSSQEKALIDAAKEATNRSYAPYSNFNVGAALRLEDGTIFQGANQENAAFSATLCAERTAIFAAQATQPEKAICEIAIAAKNADGFLPEPISPCGSCRQVIVEMEQRYKRNIKVLMYGEKKVYIVSSIKDLMPLTFSEF
ncbi:MAG: cytidine deaminase [Prevotella sp.]|nr:cytidine deaminase [Prevotella sp.]